MSESSDTQQASIVFLGRESFRMQVVDADAIPGGTSCETTQRIIERRTNNRRINERRKPLAGAEEAAALPEPLPSRRNAVIAISLADLIAECAPKPQARFLWSSGADHGVFEGVSCAAFIKDLPLQRVAADALIAYEMNGAPLRPEHGFPARLVVPGYYGTNSVKWLTRMTLADARAPGPFTARWYNDRIKDASGQPTQQIIERRRSAEFITPIPKPRKRKGGAEQESLVFDEGQGLSTKQQQYDHTAVINGVRDEVDRRDLSSPPSHKTNREHLHGSPAIVRRGRQPARDPAAVVVRNWARGLTKRTWPPLPRAADGRAVRDRRDGAEAARGLGLDAGRNRHLPQGRG